jgi:hypothetical protein
VLQHKIRYYFTATIVLLFFVLPAQAQLPAGMAYEVPAIIIGDDTMTYVELPGIYVSAPAPEWYKEYSRNQKLKQKHSAGDGSTAQYNSYALMRKRVIKVFPYAAAAGNLVYTIDSAMQHIYSTAARKAYKDRMEAALYARFKAELTDMTIAEGKILIKLISRQTGKDVYTIVNELKGKGVAVASQGVARLFGHDLRSYYEPNGEDVAIEAIVKELEFNGWEEIKF